MSPHTASTVSAPRHRTAPDAPSAVRRAPGFRRDPLLAVAAFASLGAGIVHAAVAPEHTNWWASVVFFVGLAVFQIGWAVLVLVLARDVSRAVLLFGALANAAALATWALSRTSGMPFGPHQGQAEPAARADVIAGMLGAIVVVAALTCARRRLHLHRVSRLRPAWATSGGGLAVSALSIVALTGVSGHAHSVGEEHAGHSGVASQAGAAATAPGAAATACKQAAKIEADAAFAKAVSAGNGEAAAVTKAEKVAAKQLKRALADCGSARAAAPVAPVAPAAEDEPHADDGHDH